VWMNLFLSYSPKDKSYLDKLHTHLSILKRQGLIETWFDRDIEVGANKDQEILKALEKADAFVALMSPDYIGSDYCYGVELTLALERLNANTLTIIPIIVRPCQWQRTELGDLKVLPDGELAVTQWENEDNAFNEIVEGIVRFRSVRMQSKPSARDSKSHRLASTEQSKFESSSTFQYEAKFEPEMRHLIARWKLDNPDYSPTEAMTQLQSLLTTQVNISSIRMVENSPIETWEWVKRRYDKPVSSNIEGSLYTYYVVCENIYDTYRAMGIVHRTYRAVPGAFDDLNTSPRPGYGYGIQTQIIVIAGDTPRRIRVVFQTLDDHIADANERTSRLAEWNKDNLLERIEELEYLVRQGLGQTPSIGHNKPPEPIDDNPLTRQELLAIRGMLRAIKSEPAVPVNSEEIIADAYELTSFGEKIKQKIGVGSDLFADELIRESEKVAKHAIFWATIANLLMLVGQQIVIWIKAL
jgi:TIR domain